MNYRATYGETAGTGPALGTPANRGKVRLSSVPIRFPSLALRIAAVCSKKWLRHFLPNLVLNLRMVFRLLLCAMLMLVSFVPVVLAQSRSDLIVQHTVLLRHVRLYTRTQNV